VPSQCLVEVPKTTLTVRNVGHDRVACVGSVSPALLRARTVRTSVRAVPLLEDLCTVMIGLHPLSHPCLAQAALHPRGARDPQPGEPALPALRLFWALLLNLLESLSLFHSYPRSETSSTTPSTTPRMATSAVCPCLSAPCRSPSTLPASLAATTICGRCSRSITSSRSGWSYGKARAVGSNAPLRVYHSLPSEGCKGCQLSPHTGSTSPTLAWAVANASLPLNSSCILRIQLLISAPAAHPGLCARFMQVSWLTPVEIFQPHYGSAIARYILQHHAQQAQQAQQRPEQPLRLYEVGGGTGTLARDILVRHIRRCLLGHLGLGAPAAPAAPARR
jgi:hypothetical protein